MRRGRYFVFAASVVLGGTAAHGEILTGWNFNEFTSDEHVHYSNIGDGTLTLGGNGDAWSPLQGTELNAWGEWGSGNSLGIRGVGANRSSLTIEHQFRDFAYAEFTCAMRRSATGFHSVELEYFSEAGWIKLGNASLDLEWSIARFRIPGTVGAGGHLSLRMTIEGATSSQGTARFDNMILEVAEIPVPGAWGSLLMIFRGCARRRLQI